MGKHHYEICSFLKLDFEVKHLIILFTFWRKDLTIEPENKKNHTDKYHSQIMNILDSLQP